MLSFLEYLVFFSMTADLENALISGIFGVFFSTMADFQNALISRRFGVFLSGFLHRTTLNGL